MLSNFAAFHWSVWPEMKDENENNGNGDGKAFSLWIYSNALDNKSVQKVTRLHAFDGQIWE